MTEPTNQEMIDSADALTGAVKNLAARFEKVEPEIKRQKRFGRWLAAILLLVVLALGGVGVNSYNEHGAVNQNTQNAVTTCMKTNEIRLGQIKGWDNAIDSIVNILEANTPASDTTARAAIAAGEAKQKAYAKLFATTDCKALKN